jgi:hypothetical protein
MCLSALRSPVRFLLMAVGAATLVAGDVACGWSGCGGAALIPPVIRVTDAVTGQPICDATVTAVEDGASADAGTLLQAYAVDGGRCEWGNDLPGRGTYGLTVSKAGYQTAMVQATYYEWGCGSSGDEPQPQQVNVELVPQ